MRSSRKYKTNNMTHLCFSFFLFFLNRIIQCLLRSGVVVYPQGKGFLLQSDPSIAVNLVHYHHDQGQYQAALAADWWTQLLLSGLLLLSSLCCVPLLLRTACTTFKQLFGSCWMTCLQKHLFYSCREEGSSKCVLSPETMKSPKMSLLLMIVCKKRSRFKRKDWCSGCKMKS